MVNFVLDALSATVTMAVGGSIESTPIVPIDASAVSILEVSLDAIKSVFKYQTESLDVDNADATDIKYYVDPSFWPALNPANASLTHELASGRIAEVDSEINPIPPNRQMVCHDFVRYLALMLFNTHFGVDLFQNESELLADLRTICGSEAEGQTWYDVLAKLTAVGLAGTHEGLETDADGNKFMTNATKDENNLCRVLMHQMLNSAVSRFQQIEDSEVPQSLPFQADDSISFKLIINPAEGQHETTGVEEFSGRSYEIKLVLKEDPSNIEVTDPAPEAP
jgi:hypothetical protein